MEQLLRPICRLRKRWRQVRAAACLNSLTECWGKSFNGRKNGCRADARWIALQQAGKAGFGVPIFTFRKLSSHADRTERGAQVALAWYTDTVTCGSIHVNSMYSMYMLNNGGKELFATVIPLKNH